MVQRRGKENGGFFRCMKEAIPQILDQEIGAFGPGEEIS